MPGRIAAATGAVDDQMVRDLRARQLEIMSRLDRLTDTVTALGEAVNRDRTDFDTGLAGLRQEQGAAISALEAGMKTLQQRFASAADKPATTADSGRARPAAGKQTVPVSAPAARDQASPVVAGEEWVVNIASSSHEEAMQEMAAKLQAQGIPVERHALTIEGDLMYRLRVPGFATGAEARSYARKLDKEFGLKGGWISRK